MIIDGYGFKGLLFNNSVTRDGFEPAGQRAREIADP
jgi:hypothetical protein